MIKPLLALLFLSISIARADDNKAFFGQFADTPWIMVSQCQTDNEIDALIFSRSMLEADYVVLKKGVVVQMAHLKNNPDGLAVVDANGGLNSYQRVHETVNQLMGRSFSLRKGQSLQNYLATESKGPQCR